MRGRLPLVVLGRLVEREAALGALGRVHGGVGAPHQEVRVATVVRDLDAAVSFHREILGLPLEQISDVPSQEVRIAFLTAGESKIEIVSPTTETSGVARYLASRGEGFHHLCIEVADIGAAVINEIPVYKLLLDEGLAYLHAFDGDARQIEKILATYAGKVWEAGMGRAGAVWPLGDSFSEAWDATTVESKAGLLTWFMGGDECRRLDGTELAVLRQRVDGLVLTVADAGKNFFIVDFDAIAPDLTRFLEISEQAAVTAAEVEHLGAGHNAARDDFEYYITAGKNVWPATAPAINQTVVIAE